MTTQIQHKFVFIVSSVAKWFDVSMCTYNLLEKKALGENGEHILKYWINGI